MRAARTQQRRQPQRGSGGRAGAAVDGPSSHDGAGSRYAPPRGDSGGYGSGGGGNGSKRPGGGRSSAPASVSSDAHQSTASSGDTRLRMLLSEIDQSHEADMAPTRRYRSAAGGGGGGASHQPAAGSRHNFPPPTRSSHLPTATATTSAAGAASASGSKSKRPLRPAATAATAASTPARGRERIATPAAASGGGGGLSHRLPTSLEDAHAAATSVTQTVLDLRAQLESRDDTLAGLRVQLQSTAAELDAVRKDAARLDDLAALEASLERTALHRTAPVYSAARQPARAVQRVYMRARKRACARSRGVCVQGGAAPPRFPLLDVVLTRHYHHHHPSVTASVCPCVSPGVSPWMSLSAPVSVAGCRQQQQEDVQECNKTINRHLTFIDRSVENPSLGNRESAREH